MTDAGTPRGEPRRDALAKLMFNTDAAFQRRHGIRDGYIDDWDYLGHDDLARDEFLAVADAVLQHLASQRQEPPCSMCGASEVARHLCIKHYDEYKALQALVARLGEIANDLIARLREAGSMHRNGGFVGDNIDRWLNNVELFSVPAAKKLLAEIAPTTTTP